MSTFDSFMGGVNKKYLNCTEAMDFLISYHLMRV